MIFTSGAFLNHKSTNKPAMNYRRILISFVFIVYIQWKKTVLTQNSVSFSYQKTSCQMQHTFSAWTHLSIKFDQSEHKCQCQRKPGRGHGTRSANSFNILNSLPFWCDFKKYSLSNLIGFFSCDFDQPPFFRLICIRLPSQFGVTCATYVSYLLPVFCAFFIYLDYLRFDPIVFMWWMILGCCYVFGEHANFRLLWLLQIHQF